MNYYCNTQNVMHKTNIKILSKLSNNMNKTLAELDEVESEDDSSYNSDSEDNSSYSSNAKPEKKYVITDNLIAKPGEKIFSPVYNKEYNNGYDICNDVVNILRDTNLIPQYEITELLTFLITTG